MLYDQRWDAKTKADPFSLESLIAWLEMQPADAGYPFVNAHRCLVGQWLTAKCVEHHCLNYLEVCALFDGAGAEIIQAEPWTFGAALTRARAVLMDAGA